MAKKYYAVRQGRQTGLFTSWDDCKAQVQGYSGAEFKSFASLADAQQYLWGDAAPQHGARAKETHTKEAHTEETHTPPSEPAQPVVSDAPDVMTAYVDGSYHAAKKLFAFAAVIFYQGEEYHLSGCDGDPELAEMRNVAGEIRAAEQAMAFALEHGARTLHIYHDYAGVACWCTGAWQAKKPGTQRYRQIYQQAVNQGLTVRFHKVQGHAGDRYNELADRLAKDALGIK